MRWSLPGNRDPAEAEPLLESALRQLSDPEVQPLKRGRRKSLYALDLLGDGVADHLAWVNDYPLRPATVLRLGRSKALRELQKALGVRELGLPTPLPLAAGQISKMGMLRRCIRLVPLVPGASDLKTCWKKGEVTGRRAHEVALAFGEFCAEVFAAGVFQEDFAPNNFLLLPGEGKPEFMLIDFERVQVLPALKDSQKRWMLMKLQRHFLGISNTLRLRFLQGLCGGQKEEARDWWRSLESQAYRLALRDFRKMRRDAVSQGRRFRKGGGQGWVGFRVHSEGNDSLLETVITRQGEPTRSQGISVHGDRWRITYPDMTLGRAKEAWVLAQSVWARGELGPRPLGLFYKDRIAVLILRRPNDGLLLSEVPDPALLRGELVLFLKELLLVGEFQTDPSADDLAVDALRDRRLRVQLLSPHGYRFRGSHNPLAGPQARALADQIISRLRYSS